jgi:hypothetical protein
MTNYTTGLNSLEPTGMNMPTSAIMNTSLQITTETSSPWVGSPAQRLTGHTAACRDSTPNNNLNNSVLDVHDAAMLGDVNPDEWPCLTWQVLEVPLINTENMLVDLANSSLPTNMARVSKRLSLLNTENASLGTDF